MREAVLYRVMLGLTGLCNAALKGNVNRTISHFATVNESVDADPSINFPYVDAARYVIDAAFNF
jgi:hypothetical protein